MGSIRERGCSHGYTRRTAIDTIVGTVCGLVGGFGAGFFFGRLPSDAPLGTWVDGVEALVDGSDALASPIDVQRMLGVGADNKIGPQTRYALETLLLRVEKKHGLPFEGTTRGSFNKEIYGVCNRVREGDLGILLNNVEALAFSHFGAYIMDDTYRKNTEIIDTLEKARRFLGFQNGSREGMGEALLAFKATMNYKHGISMPMNSKLDDTTFIALNYARELKLDMTVENYSHAEVSERANGTLYKFLIPSLSISEFPSLVYARDAHVEDTEVFPEDPVLRMVALEVTKGKNSKEEQARRLLSFVQAPTYTFDVQGGDYTKHPLRTLSDRTGDCEDSTALALSLFRTRGIRCGKVFVRDHRRGKPNHAMAAVSGNFRGTYLEDDESGVPERFYLAETTGKNWQVGRNLYEDVDQRLVGYHLSVVGSRG